MTDYIRSFLNRSVTFRRYRAIVLKGGWAHLFRRRWIERQILKTRPIRTEAYRAAPGTPCEVHILTRGVELRTALWAAKSFYAFAGVTWPLVWHQGGQMGGRHHKLIRRHFPDSHLLGGNDADAAMAERLTARGLPGCLESRRRSVMMRKLLDCLVLSAADNLLILDSDVLFFDRPDEIVEAGESYLARNIFSRDCADWPYSIHPDTVKRRYGLDLVPRLNAGLTLIRRDSVPLELVEEFLKDPDLMNQPLLAEQTLHALLASGQGAGFLPETYTLSLGPGLTTPDLRPVKAKHYAMFPRPFLYEEGMRELMRRGFISRLAP